MKQIPNLFTLLNLVFGCIAIVMILQFEPYNNGLNLSGLAMLYGCICILLAAVVDFLDGFVARLFKATSAMGEQLDSLADAVSFGVAPGMIMYKLLELSYSHTSTPPNFWLYLPAVIVPCAAVWRLAKFNLDKEQRYYFKGVPTPAAGLFIASLPMLLGRSVFENILLNPYALYAIIILISGLMVSNIPILSLKFKDYTLKGNIPKLLLLVVAVASAFLLNWAAIPIVFLAYVIVSLIFKPNKI